MIQRVTRAAVHVEGAQIAAIGPGILALVGVERGDSEAQAARLAQRVVSYRIFADAAGKMNRSLQDVAGELLAVPQFTLVAETGSGARPGFSSGASPEHGMQLFERFLYFSKARASGRFGAHMQVSLVNDGPVTFWLRAPPQAAS